MAPRVPLTKNILVCTAEVILVARKEDGLREVVIPGCLAAGCGEELGIKEESLRAREGGTGIKEESLRAREQVLRRLSWCLSPGCHEQELLTGSRAKPARDRGSVSRAGNLLL